LIGAADAVTPLALRGSHARREGRAQNLQTRRTALLLFLSSSNTNDKETTSEAAETSNANPRPAAGAADLEDDEVSSNSVTRTLFLAVPLFCKFVLVLMIKFVTDLIVYPLLLLYRSARMGKRRVLRLFRGTAANGNKSVNGEKE
jgi:hypothetical protein